MKARFYHNPFFILDKIVEVNMKNQKQNQQSVSLSNKAYPSFTFRGTHRQIGQQFGEACSDRIQKHLDYALLQLEKDVKVTSSKALEEAALQYQPYVKKYAPSFDEEIRGLAEGAGITLGEAYFLQLRAEMYQHFSPNDHECTTFAVLPEASQDGTPLIGQNVDLHSFYIDCNVVVEIVPNEGPAFLMLTPAGQVSFVGINNRGLGVFGNFLTCDGWRVGFPRYMLSRLALTKESVKEAASAIENVHRASSRNLILIDNYGKAVDLEVTPNAVARIEPENGLIAHSNHFIADGLLEQEKKVGEDLVNSQTRLNRMKELLELNNGHINVTVMEHIMRDRTSAPHTLCRMPGDFGTGTTSASVIAEPSKGKLWIAIGPPSQYAYKCYKFSS
jgi:isopenicillin-N N-acyltransferase-like protein